MIEEDICLKCGERMYLEIIQNTAVFFCPCCDDDYDDDDDNLDPCICRYDEINPMCPYCFC